MSRVQRLDYTPTSTEVVPVEPTIVEIRGEQFRLTEALPGWVVFQLGVMGDPDLPTSERMNIVRRLVQTLIADEDWQRFETLLYKATPTINTDELSSYLYDLIALVSGGPTQGQGSSEGSEPDTLTGSTDGSEPQVEIPSGGSAL